MRFERVWFGTFPELSGVECAGRIAAIDDDASVPAVSAPSDKSIAIAAVKKDARGFLHKPFARHQPVQALPEMPPT